MAKGMTIKSRVLTVGITIFLANALLVGALVYRSQVGQLRESLRDLPRAWPGLTLVLPEMPSYSGFSGKGSGRSSWRRRGRSLPT
jgi:hypothetical protein